MKHLFPHRRLLSADLERTSPVGPVSRFLKCKCHDKSPGFTLVELLIVIALILIVLTLANTLLSTRSNDMTRASDTLHDIFQRARTHATTNNNYVYVGISDTTGPGSELFVAVAESTDGLGSDTNDLNPARIRPAVKAEELRGVLLDTATANSNLPGQPLDGNPGNQVEEIEDSLFTFDADVVTNRTDITGDEFTWVVQFSPDGAARIETNDNSVPDFIVLGLVPATQNAANSAGFVIDGPSGSIRVIRPEVGS